MEDLITSNKVETPKAVYLKNLFALLAPVANLESLVEIAFLFSNGRSGYGTSGWTFGAATISRSESGSIEALPLELSVHHATAAGESTRFLDLGRFENFFNAADSYVPGKGVLLDTLFDQGMAAFMNDPSTNAAFLERSTLKSFTRADARDDEVLSTLSSQVLPTINNRHSTSCASCHLGEAVLPFLFELKMEQAQVASIVNPKFEAFDAHLRSLPIGRNGSADVFALDGEGSLAVGRTQVQGLPQFGFNNSRAFGYMNEVPHCSIRAFAEISDTTDAFVRLGF